MFCEKFRVVRRPPFQLGVSGPCVLRMSKCSSTLSIQNDASGEVRILLKTIYACMRVDIFAMCMMEGY